MTFRGAEAVDAERVHGAPERRVGNDVKAAPDVAQGLAYRRIRTEVRRFNPRDSSVVANCQASIAEVLGENALDVRPLLRIVAPEIHAHRHTGWTRSRFHDELKTETRGSLEDGQRHRRNGLRELSAGAGNSNVCDDGTRGHRRRALSQGQRAGSDQVRRRYEAVLVRIDSLTAEQESSRHRRSGVAIAIEDLLADLSHVGPGDEAVAVRIAGDRSNGERSIVPPGREQNDAQYI